MIQHFFFIILSTLAILQVVFLPGWILTHFLKLSNSPDDSLWRRLTIGFGLSLMFNYWVIFILGLIHHYRFNVLAALVVIEFVILIAIHRKNFRQFFVQSIGTSCSTAVYSIKKYFARCSAWLHEEFQGESKNYIKLIALVLALGTLIYIVYLFVDNLGTIFKLNDAVVSWNRWAVEWSTNAVPKNTWEYPQLLPANWSVFYVMLGTPIEYLSKMIMPLFPFFIALYLFLLGIKKKSWDYIIAVPATILLMRLMIGSEIMATEGYADTAVAFFGAFSLLSLLWSKRDEPKTELSRNLLVGALFAAGALMTKQAGLFVIIIYPIAAWFLVFKNNMELRKSIPKYIFIYLGLLIVLAGPFFIFKELAIAAHQDVTVTADISKLLYGGGKSVLAVSAHALYFLIGKTHGIILLYLLLLIIALRDRRYRIFGILVTILYTIVWSIFNSYDTRNLTLALPFWGLAAGVGVDRLFLQNGSGEKWLNRCVSRIKLGYIAIAILVITIGLGSWIRGKVTEHYNQDKRYMIDTDLSVLLNNYFGNNPAAENNGGKILTNYGMLYFFPTTAERIYSPFGGFSTTKNDFDNYAVDSLNPKVSYILAAFYSDKATFADIEKKIADGRFTLIFRENGNILVKTNNS